MQRAPAVSRLVFVLGLAYLWPLFIFPLFLGAVFFFELGSLRGHRLAGHLLRRLLRLRGPRRRRWSAGPARHRALRCSPACCWAGCSAATTTTQALLAASSLNDRLTGLYNYGTFVDYLHNEVTKVDRYGGELTLIMLDLDHFKQFNDRYGHESGNDLLRRVGATLRAMVRDADMAARYGGEEFAVLIRGDESHGYELAERVRRAVEALSVELRGGRRPS